MIAVINFRMGTGCKQIISFIDPIDNQVGPECLILGICFSLTGSRYD